MGLERHPFAKAALTRLQMACSGLSLNPLRLNNVSREDNKAHWVFFGQILGCGEVIASALTDTSGPPIDQTTKNEILAVILQLQITYTGNTEVSGILKSLALTCRNSGAIDPQPVRK